VEEWTLLHDPLRPNRVVRSIGTATSVPTVGLFPCKGGQVVRGESRQKLVSHITLFDVHNSHSGRSAILLGGVGFREPRGRGGDDTTDIPSSW